MNRRRTDFLERNKDPLVKQYLLGKDHNVCQKFHYYFKDDKGKAIILLPYCDNVWTEDRIELSTIHDLEEFRQFYEQKRNTSILLDELK
jgi:hypothetical protein